MMHSWESKVQIRKVIRDCFEVWGYFDFGSCWTQAKGSNQPIGALLLRCSVFCSSLACLSTIWIEGMSSICGNSPACSLSINVIASLTVALPFDFCCLQEASMASVELQLYTDWYSASSACRQAIAPQGLYVQLHALYYSHVCPGTKTVGILCTLVRH